MIVQKRNLICTLARDDVMTNAKRSVCTVLGLTIIGVTLFAFAENSAAYNRWRGNPSPPPPPDRRLTTQPPNFKFDNWKPPPKIDPNIGKGPSVDASVSAQPQPSR